MVDVMRDVTEARCGDVTPETNVSFEQICAVVGDIYEARGVIRQDLGSDSHEHFWNGKNALGDLHEDLEQLFPAGNPYFPNEALSALWSSESELDRHFRPESRFFHPDTVEFVMDAEPLHEFARTCPNVPRELIELPSLFEVAGVSAEEIIAAAIAAAPQPIDTSELDIETYRAAVNELVDAFPEPLMRAGFLFTIDEQLDRFLEDGTHASFSVGIFVGEAGDPTPPDGLEIIREGLQSLLPAPEYALVESCVGEESYDFVYRNTTGSTGPILISGWEASVNPGTLSVALPGQPEDVFGELYCP